MSRPRRETSFCPFPPNASTICNAYPVWVHPRISNDAFPHSSFTAASVWGIVPEFSMGCRPSPGNESARPPERCCELLPILVSIDFDFTIL